MLETSAPKTLQDHYTRAHVLRARAFADSWAALRAVFARKKKGPRLVAQPQSC